MLNRIEKVAVIGSGIMGGGIAALCAGAGVKTLLLDIVPFDLKDEEKNDPKARNRIVQAGLDTQLKIKPPAFFDKPNDLKRLEIGNLEDDFEKLSDCDLIIEVVIENLKIKQELFTRIENIRKPDTIIASNTSGLPLHAMTEGRSQSFKAHFLIMHFFNPPRLMKLLEVVTGPDTSPGVKSFIGDWGEKTLGKGIVWAKDTPNFVGNRIGVMNFCEALHVINNEDITIPEFDAAYGPALAMPSTALFALADLVGLDTNHHLAVNTYDLLVEDENREAYKMPAFFTELFEKGHYGRKTPDKGGFYKVEVDPATRKKQFKVLDIKTGGYVPYDRNDIPDVVREAKKEKSLAERQKKILFADNRISKIAWKMAAKCLIYAANRVPEISDTVVGIDDAMRWGYAQEVGPFETWDNLGVRQTVEKMQADGLTVPAPVLKMLEGGNESFYRIKDGKKQYFDFTANQYADVDVNEKCVFLANLKADNKRIGGNPSVSLIDLGDGVFNIEFHTKMNAMNGETGEYMIEAIDYAVENGAGLVIANQAPGMPGAFSAGGDLAYMGGLAKAGKFTEIDGMIKGLHEMIFKLKYSPIPVVAAPYGMTLGGGCEVCLASDRIVAHMELFMGLVEIGAGLLPGGCGIMHLWQRYMDGVPAKVTLTDLAPFMAPAFRLIAQAQVSGSAAEARNFGFLRPSDRIIMNRDHLIGEAKKEVLRMADDGYQPPVQKKYPVMGQEGQGLVLMEMDNMANGGFLPKHMEAISEKILYCLTGGEARMGQLVSEAYLCKLEREAFVDLWRTPETQKMADHILKTGKPLMI